jgi:hypothetical protein
VTPIEWMPQAPICSTQDLSDIKETIFKDNFFSPNLIQVSQEATKEDIESILRTTKAFRTSEIDSITNGFL